MRECKQCGVSIRDSASVCPLCGCVLREGGAGRDAYPEIWLREGRLLLISRIFLFSALALSTALVWINSALYPHYPWWIYPAAGLFYTWLILRAGFASRLGYRGKTVLLLFSALAILIAIDGILGFYGWSVDYAVPACILLADAAIAVLMLVNMRNWQSYLLFQLGVLLCSLLPLLLWRLGLVAHPLFSFIALGITVLLVLGSLIIGFRRAGVELRRRFHL